MRGVSGGTLTLWMEGDLGDALRSAWETRVIVVGDQLSEALSYEETYDLAIRLWIKREWRSNRGRARD